MKRDPNIGATRRSPQRNRRSIRLRGYDYSRAGAYFITICTQNRECLFGEIADGEMRMNVAGVMIQTVWDDLPTRFDHIELDEFTIMPNHIHGIIAIFGIGRGESCIRPDISRDQQSGDHKSGDQQSGDHQTHDHKSGDQQSGDHKMGDHKDRPYGTLPGTVGRIVQAFKSITTHEYISGVKQNGWTPFPGKLWQRNYWEHIIRNESELYRIREYIKNNPAQWELDKLYGPALVPAHEISEPSAEYAMETWMT